MDNKKDIIEIDLAFLFKKIWSKKIIVIATALLFAAIMITYNIFVTKPTYTSTTKIYAVNQNDKEKTVTVQDIQVGTNLVKDYQQIILSSEVLNKVIEDKKLKVSTGFLASKISIDSPKDTRVINITVRDQNPERASELANAVRESSIKKIKEITKIKDITVIEEAKPAKGPSSPNVQRNGVIAFLAGLLTAIGVIVLKEMIDDRVKRPEDIEEVMDLVLLGTIPKIEKGK